MPVNKETLAEIINNPNTFSPDGVVLANNLLNLTPEQEKEFLSPRYLKLRLLLPTPDYQTGVTAFSPETAKQNHLTYICCDGNNFDHLSQLLNRQPKVAKPGAPLFPQPPFVSLEFNGEALLAPKQAVGTMLRLLSGGQFTEPQNLPEPYQASAKVDGNLLAALVHEATIAADVVGHYGREVSNLGHPEDFYYLIPHWYAARVAEGLRAKILLPQNISSNGENNLKINFNLQLGNDFDAGRSLAQHGMPSAEW